MAGTGIRYLWFARELARRGHDVTLVVPFATDLVETAFAIRVDNPWHANRMTSLAHAHDAVVAQRLPVPTMLALARSRIRTIYDLYAPLTIEQAALGQGSSVRRRADSDLNRLTQRVALETGDTFLCASERQRDLWLGALTALGRITPDAYRRDPSFRSLIDVVPFGVDPSPPADSSRVLKGVVPGIEETDKVALWGGGIWDWLDPLTVIRAVHRLGRPDVKLFVLGTRSPNPAVPLMGMEVQALRLAEELGLVDRSVFFNHGWVPFEQRAGYLLEADVGVSAHRDELEARFAFRTRLLDCIWAGLPVVTTEGDSVAALIEQRELGSVVRCGDVDGFALALARVLDQDRSEFAGRFAETRALFEWPRVVEPLAQMLDAGKPDSRTTSHRLIRTADYAVARTRLAVATRGIRGIGSRAVVGIRRRLQGDHAAHPETTPAARGNPEDPPI
jgi:glycosyltransferase involved in cell wall biosynthesis